MSKIDPKYRTTVTVQGGREGHAVSDDGLLDVQLRRPKTNGMAGGTNPEQLFAAAWGGCYERALIAGARDRGEGESGSSVRGEHGKGSAEGGGHGLAAKIAVEVPGMDKAKAQELAEAAHARCPYSRATRGNIEVEVVVI